MLVRSPPPSSLHPTPLCHIEEHIQPASTWPPLLQVSCTFVRLKQTTWKHKPKSWSIGPYVGPHYSIRQTPGLYIIIIPSAWRGSTSDASSTCSAWQDHVPHNDILQHTDSICMESNLAGRQSSGSLAISRKGFSPKLWYKVPLKVCNIKPSILEKLSRWATLYATRGQTSQGERHTLSGLRCTTEDRSILIRHHTTSWSKPCMS